MPELGALFVALAALLIIWAWQSWTVKVLQAFKVHAPGLFGPLFDALIAADSAVYNTLRGWADNATQPFTVLVDRAIASIDALISNPLLFARAVSAALVRLFTVTIPDAITAAETTARGLFVQAEADAQALLQGTEQALASLPAELAGLGQRIEEAFQSAVGYALQLAHQVEAEALGLFQQAEQEAAALIGQEAGRAEAVEQAIVDRVDRVAVEAAQEVRAVEERGIRYIDRVAVEKAEEIARARAELEHDIRGFDAVLEAEIAKVLDSPVWQEAVALYGLAAGTYEKGVEGLAILAIAEVRRQVKDVEALRRRYAPLLADLGSRLAAKG